MERGQAVGRAVVRRRLERRAHGRLVVAVGVGAAERGVVDVAVAAVLLHGDAGAGRGAERAADDRAEIARAVVADPCFYIGHEFVGRPIAANVDEPGERARAEARALRAAQDLDLARVEQHAGVGRTAEVDVVERDPDRREVFRIDELLEIADAPHLDEAGSRAAARVVDVRGDVQHGLEVLRRTVAGRFLVDDRRAARARHEIAVAKAGRDDDFLEFLGGELCRESGKREQRGERASRGMHRAWRCAVERGRAARRGADRRGGAARCRQRRANGGYRRSDSGQQFHGGSPQ